MNRLRYIVTILLFATLTISCSKRTNDANETFKYWSGSEVPDDIKLLKGQYYESPHLTKKWWFEYLKYNSILIDKKDWTKPSDAPIWFKPSETSLRFYRKDFDQGSRYFYDSASGICYIYEIQL